MPEGALHKDIKTKIGGFLQSLGWKVGYEKPVNQKGKRGIADIVAKKGKAAFWVEVGVTQYTPREHRLRLTDYDIDILVEALETSREKIEGEEVARLYLRLKEITPSYPSKEKIERLLGSKKVPKAERSFPPPATPKRKTPKTDREKEHRYYGCRGCGINEVQVENCRIRMERYELYGQKCPREIELIKS